MLKGVEQMTVDYSLVKTTSQVLSQSDTDRSARVYDLVRPLIFRMQPETAHHVTLALLRIGGAVAPARGLLSAAFRPTAANRTVQAFGLTFPNAVGLAAGYDKDGLGWRGLATMGFGHIEVGTVTPRPQSRQPRPARLPAGGRSGSDQPHGLPQPRRRVCGAAAGWKASSRPDPGRQYRQEPDHLAGACGRRLSKPGQGLCALSPTT